MSGAEMFRSLVEAMTGLKSDEINDHYCRDRPPTCKTHWPAFDRYAHVAERSNEFHTHSILLVRSPRRALPSWFNWKWEQKHHLASHTVVAPKADWVDWRNRVFVRQLNKWKSMFVQWRESVPSKVALYVPYEELVVPETGPAWLEKIHALLQESGTPLIPVDDLPCIWHRIVKGKLSSKTKRKDGGYTPSFSHEQKELFLDRIDTLSQLFSNESQVTRILQIYRDDIQQNTPLDTDEQPFQIT